MKAREFITEDQTGLSWVEQAANDIRANCQPYLRQVGNDVTQPLYRGFNPTTVRSNFTIMKCPVDRNPTSTDSEVHWISDQWFLDQFGVRFRSNAVFASGNYYQADTYGRVCAIFPIGEFKFCYSPIITDLFDSWEDGRISRHSGDELKSAISRILTSGRYQTTNLQEAIQSGSEIMIHCDTYYRINSDPFKLSTVLSTLQHELDV